MTKPSTETIYAAAARGVRTAGESEAFVRETLQQASTRDLASALILIQNTLNGRGVAEAIRAVIDERLMAKQVNEMKKLERVGVLLAIVGLLLAVPSAIVAIEQVMEWIS